MKVPICPLFSPFINLPFPWLDLVSSLRYPFPIMHDSPRILTSPARRPSLFSFVFSFLVLLSATFSALGLDAPSGLVSRIGDQSIVLHWDPVMDPSVTGYRVYRAATNTGPFTSVTPTPVTIPGFADVNVLNDRTNYYYVTALASGGVESPPSPTLALASRIFASDDEFLDYVQQTSFDYFWYSANPANGLVPDRSPTTAPCSIAAVGFGLSAIPIAVDHGWISRTQAAQRVHTTLNTFLSLPQGPTSSGVIGHNGWFYHFLDMKTGLRYSQWNTELSSIDTALLLAGMLDCKQYFTSTNTQEVAIRSMADTIFNRVDWNWMAQGTNALSMGWIPGTGFLSAKWVGYNEAMILYIMGMGAATNPLPASSWSRWTNGYSWGTYYGQSFLFFPPLFGHQYSHAWVDFRHIADPYMQARQSTYFENSRRATLAQRAYCTANPAGHIGYSSNVWGLTACDGPNGYAARGAPPPLTDDGTIAPTAAGGSIAFAPEVCVPTLRHFYRFFRRNLWTSFGFRDAFNQGAQWWATDCIGIDQGPFVLMIENYRNQRVWNRFMKNPEIQRGLDRAGFKPVSFVNPTIRPSAPDTIELNWTSPTNRVFQVEYSPDLFTWFSSPDGRLTNQTEVVSWTNSSLSTTPMRFFRAYEFGR